MIFPIKSSKKLGGPRLEHLSSDSFISKLELRAFCTIATSNSKLSQKYVYKLLLSKNKVNPVWSTHLNFFNAIMAKRINKKISILLVTGALVHSNSQFIVYFAQKK